MTTPYKQALDDLYLTESEDWTRENMPLIRRALLIADAVDGRSLDKDLLTAQTMRYFAMLSGYNIRLRELRRIGEGE